MVFSTTAFAQTTSTAATNLVVDFDETLFDSTLSPGDSGIMNLVVKNTGGYAADDVQVYLPSSGAISIDKRFYIGRLDVGGSKTLPVVVRVSKGATSGLTAVNVRIDFDGYKSDGTVDNNQFTTWDVPLRIYGKPLFQITPSKTTFYKDTLDTLSFSGTLASSVKDLQATLSSDCLTVIGSSKTFIGDLKSNVDYAIGYEIKPTRSGACKASLSLEYTDESGNSATDNVTIGLNVEDAGVDFKVVEVTYTPTGPGQQTDVKILLRNVGNAEAQKVTVTLNTTSPFSPVETSEVYIPAIGAGEETSVNFKLAVGWDAQTQAYSLPITIAYKVGGTSYSISKQIGLDIAGRVILQVINVGSSSGSVRIDVANIGTRTADGVKATLIVPSSDQQQTYNRSMQGGVNASRTGGFQRMNSSSSAGGASYVSYKSDIKPNKQSTFTFATTASGTAILELEYTGNNNERVTQTERITLGSGSTGNGLRSTTRTTATDNTLYYVGAAAILAYLVYRKYRRKR